MRGAALIIRDPQRGNLPKAPTYTLHSSPPNKRSLQQGRMWCQSGTRAMGSEAWARVLRIAEIMPSSPGPGAYPGAPVPPPRYSAGLFRTPRGHKHIIPEAA